MAEFVRLGGGGMWPVIVLGLSALATSIALLVRPSRATFALAIATSIGTLLTGALGTLVGMRASHAAGTLAEGVGPALHPILLALYFLGGVWLPATLGAYRLAKKSEPT